MQANIAQSYLEKSNKKRNVMLYELGATEVLDREYSSGIKVIRSCCIMPIGRKRNDNLPFSSCSILLRQDPNGKRERERWTT